MVPGKTGRVADIDGNGCVIAIVPVGAKKNPIPVDPKSVIWPRTGVSMLREKKKLRPSVPSNVLRLKNMWQTVKSAQCHFSQQPSASSGSDQPSDSSTASLPCNICDILSVKDQPVPDVELGAVASLSPEQEEHFLRGSLFQCTFCGLSFHTGCEQRVLMSHINSLGAEAFWGQSSIARLADISIPPVFLRGDDHDEAMGGAPPFPRLGSSLSESFGFSPCASGLINLSWACPI